VAGPFSVVVDARLRTAADVHDFEQRLSQAVPALQIQDRSVVLRTTKLLGRVLDREGRSVRSVPFRAAHEKHASTGGQPDPSTGPPLSNAHMTTSRTPPS
jgi:hypothetical protein